MSRFCCAKTNRVRIKQKDHVLGTFFVKKHKQFSIHRFRESLRYRGTMAMTKNIKSIRSRSAIDELDIK